MNRLEYRSEFEAVLKDYHLSDEASKLLKDIRLVLLAGPSAAGRNTIINRLVATGNYQYIVSDTTRAPRINDGVEEKDGVTYWFRKEKDFLEDLKQGEFLEAEIIHEQQVSGISMRELDKANRSGKIAINEVEIGGFLNILKLKPSTMGIYVLPPSFELWMERLKHRGEMPKEEIASRLNTGVRIFSEALAREDSTIVVNYKIEETVRKIEYLVDGARNPGTDDGRKVASELLRQTKVYLRES